jgi:hypothetical protein
MSAFNSVGTLISEHPMIAAGAVVVGLFVLTRGGGGGGGGGTDYSATLRSAEIASQTNIALADIGAQRDAARYAMQRDIALGQLDYEKTAKTASITHAIAAGDNARMVTEGGQITALQAFQSSIGYGLGIRDLQNKRVELGNMEILGLHDIDATKEINLAGIHASADVSRRAIEADLEGMRIGLPFQERMHYQEQETTRNLAWRQKQIAKQGFMANLLGGIVDGGFNLLGQGMSMFGGAK